jgi:RNA polymerase sigma factor FliA
VGARVDPMRGVAVPDAGASVIDEQHNARVAPGPTADVVPGRTVGAEPGLTGIEDPHAAAGVEAVWESFRGSQDASLRHRLIEHYMPFARKLANQVYRRAIPPCSFEDYLQNARLGLIEAVDGYDPARGVSFEVYSKRRIRGSMLSAVGHESEAAAQREFARRSMPERMASLSARPRASLQELFELTVGIALGVLLDREEVDVPDESPHANPYAVAELGQLAQRVRALVECLPQRECEVIRGHYFDRMEFRVLAERLAVSKVRVSQLHHQGLRRLHELLAAPPRVNRTL